MQLRSYQTDIAEQAANLINRYRFCYISAQVRTGKTLMALETAKILGKERVVFITKKMAFTSIMNDFMDFEYNQYFTCEVINKESINHFVTSNPDFIIIDEAHGFGAFPKAGVHQKNIRSLFQHKEMLFLSGTPCPESWSQIYHQLQLTRMSPFGMYRSFYAWAKDYVTIKQIRTSYGLANDYSGANFEKIMDKIKPYILTQTQEDSGFKTNVEEETLIVKMKDSTYALIEKLKKDLVIQGKKGTIVADTAVNLKNKLLQMYSGTVKTEEGESVVFDTTKAEFIKERFAGKQIAVFYKFKGELEMLKEVLGSKFTDSLDEFNANSHKWICLQFQRGSQGISLAQAEHIIFLNTDYSCMIYQQARDRLTTMTRLYNKIYWICSEGGVEEKVLKIVRQKKSYSNKIFLKDFGITNKF